MLWLRPLALLLGLILPSVAIGFETLETEGIALKGHFQQGGFVIGKAHPEYTVAFSDRVLSQDENGQFVFGFHRDDPVDQFLTITSPDGVTRRLDIPIQERLYDIQRIDGLPPKSVTPPQALLDRIARERDLVKATRRIDSPLSGFSDQFIWPADGRISGIYGSQRILNGEPRWPHFGIDIASPKGTPVKAPASGIIRLAEPDLYYSGGTIILDHGQGLSSAFLHLERLDVSVGEAVDQGDIIGTVGSTGRSTGPHLDWRMNWFEKRIDPEFLVPKRR